MIRSMLKSLLKPEAYPEPTSGVELIQTHVSYIFLTDTHAYKIKKAVDFGFLNFSTIDRRRFYCNEEVRLNRRLCPDIYLGVVEVRQAGNGAAFTGDGPVIDHAVKMKRLPGDRMLDRLVARNQVGSEEMRAIARTIAEFHRTAASCASLADYGRPDRIMYNWQENFEQVLPFESSTLPASDREVIRTWVQRFLAEHEDLLLHRVEEGFIRECDGDIHLENICLTDDNIYIFDCIEFNERFRCCDTAADIAFLLMDLDFHGRRDLSDDIIDEYLTVSGDSGITGLIDFYKVYRGFVRGKVESFRFADAVVPVDEQQASAQRATRYFRLARGYCERWGMPATLFITCGLMGSGKSTLAEQLAFELGLTILSSDRLRKELAGVHIHQPLRDCYDQGAYSPEARQAVYDTLLEQADILLAGGVSLVVDAGFCRLDQRSRFGDLARRHGVRFVILYQDTSEPEIRRRLELRSAGGDSVSDGRLELLPRQMASFQAPDDSEGTVVTLGQFRDMPSALNGIYARLKP